MKLKQRQTKWNLNETEWSGTGLDGDRSGWNDVTIEVALINECWDVWCDCRSGRGRLLVYLPQYTQWTVSPAMLCLLSIKYKVQRLGLVLKLSMEWAMTDGMFDGEEIFVLWFPPMLSACLLPAFPSLPSPTRTLLPLLPSHSPFSSSSSSRVRGRLEVNIILNSQHKPKEELSRPRVPPSIPCFLNVSNLAWKWSAWAGACITYFTFMTVIMPLPEGAYSASLCSGNCLMSAFSYVCVFLFYSRWRS